MYIQLLINGTQYIINTDSNTYGNCHRFTRDVIMKLRDQGVYLGPGGAFRQNFYDRLRRAMNVGDFMVAYGMLLQHAARFDATNVGGLPTGGLVLFWSENRPEAPHILQHSMIVPYFNRWMGANNTYSIGIGGENPIDATGVSTYDNVHQRVFNPPQFGGWQGNVFRSVTGDINDMYFVQFHR